MEIRCLRANVAAVSPLAFQSFEGRFPLLLRRALHASFDKRLGGEGQERDSPNDYEAAHTSTSEFEAVSLLRSSSSSAFSWSSPSSRFASHGGRTERAFVNRLFALFEPTSEVLWLGRKVGFEKSVGGAPTDTRAPASKRLLSVRLALTAARVLNALGQRALFRRRVAMRAPPSLPPPSQFARLARFEAFGCVTSS